MALLIDPHTVVAFDLDDTLYAEVDFVASGLAGVRRLLESRVSGPVADLFSLYRSGDHDPIGTVCRQHGLEDSVHEELVEWLRQHQPEITLTRGARDLLECLARHSVPMALVTDGRSVTQRRKIEGLGIASYFSCIVISEELGSSKPDVRNFQRVADTTPARQYVYVGDNPAKDVVGARALGWVTVGLEPSPGQVHYADILAAPGPRADHVVRSLSELIPFVR